VLSISIIKQTPFTPELSQLLKNNVLRTTYILMESQKKNEYVMLSKWVVPFMRIILAHNNTIVILERLVHEVYRSSTHSPVHAV
jgi:hypothetical protein